MPNISWNGGSGEWTDETGWTPQQVPGSGDTATISGTAAADVLIGGSDSIVVSGVVLDDATGTLEVDGILSAGSITLTSGVINDDGTIANATIVNNGGTLDFGYGLLQADTIVGALDVGSTGTAVVQQGLTVENADSTAGTITIDGADSTLLFNDSETFDNATIVIGSTTGLDNLDAGGTLTLGEGVLVETTAAFFNDTLGGEGTIINDGSILADASSGTMAIESTSFINDGGITVTDGADLDIQPYGTFANNGRLAISDGGTIAIQYLTAFTNTGSIQIGSGSELDLDTYASALTQTQTTGGTVEIDGVLNAEGETLNVDSAGAFSELDNYGTLENATLVLNGGTLGLSDSVFQNDTIQGALTIGDGDTIVVQSGFTVENADGTPGTISLTGAEATLEVADDETIDNATIVMGNATDLDTLQADGTLTLGSGLMLETAPTITTDMITGGGTIINDGSILADGTSGTVILETTDFDNEGSMTVAGGQALDIQVFGTFANDGRFAILSGSTVTLADATAFTNTGSIQVGSGAQLDLYDYAPDMSQGQTVGGTLEIDGIVDAGGNTISVDSAGAFSELDNYGTLENATLVLNGGTLGLSDSVFQNDTIQGALTIGDGDTIVVQSGFAITGVDGTSPGLISITGAEATLEVTDDETLSNTTIVIGNADDVSTLEVDGTLTLGSNTTIETAPTIVSDAITGAGTVINDGAVTGDAATGNLVLGTTDFDNAGLVSVSGGASLDIQTSDSFDNSGTLSIASGSVGTVDSVNTFSNTGSIVLNGGTLTVDAVLDGTSGGVTSLSNAGQLELGAGATADQTVTFLDGTDSLILDDVADFAGTVSGFQTGDSIVLDGFAGATESYADGVLTFTETSTVVGQTITTTGTIQIEGNYQASDFSTTTDANGDLILTTDVLPCFAAGTLILTADGEVAVEALKEGDEVVTVTDGKRRLMPITWIGHRAIDISRHPAPEKVRPVRVQRGAFAPNMPARDLLLSPDHAIFAEGVLVPVKYLVNGTTIRVEEAAKTVLYFHVELERHEVLLSDGLPTESYLDSGGRAMFENGGSAVVLHADFSHIAWDVLGCAPLKVTGPEVARIQKRLAARVRQRKSEKKSVAA
jgi:hypothetical protein